MRIQFRSRNLQASDKLKDYVEKRLSKMNKLIDKETEATVSLIGEKNRQRIEITIPLNGFILRGEEEAEDLFTAADLVTDKLEKQLVRSKERFAKKGRLSVTKLPTLAGLSPAADDDEEVKVRIKQFPAKPMTLDEAITRMDMIGHTFFAFHNSESSAINVVYRRNDGHYGLLEPEN
ncbi:MAG: ribosome-associated translation inhibitor RaiA [Peptococcaceae bacterium]|jgi:putative sigma-54 modulation protein|nr:ribosome-associated translation inhibitor RaiA [Peptococcaceae bacterium]